jgi:hypothetical protein
VVPFKSTYHMIFSRPGWHNHRLWQLQKGKGVRGRRSRDTSQTYL